MLIKRLLRTLSLVIFLAGVVMAAFPADLIAESCTAGNGASCDCAGKCKKSADYCWCEPPAY